MSDDFPHERRSSPQVDMHALQTHITQAIVAALKETAKDKDFSKEFWRQGYVELAEHSSNGASQWIGKKLMVWAATAMAGALIMWLVKTGAIK